MNNISDGLDDDNPAGQRFAGQATYRGIQRRESVLGHLDQGTEGGHRATDTSITGMPSVLESSSPPSASINDLDPLTEPSFPPTGWLDDTPTGTLADHPLLRGLLLELPPKGTVPSPGWLDRWFDAARAILDLLYLQNAHGTRRP